MTGNQAASVKGLEGEIAAADGVVFVTPEYNRSIPGVLKNAIGHASRLYGQSAWKGKPAGVIWRVDRSSRRLHAQYIHLGKILAYLDVPALGQP
jgi:chromate reductase